MWCLIQPAVIMIADGNLEMKGYLKTIFRAIGFEKEWSGLMTWQWGTSTFSGGGFTHLLSQLCWLFGSWGLEWIFSSSYRFLKLFNQCAFLTGWVILVQSIYWAPTTWSVQAELGGKTQRKHEAWSLPQRSSQCSSSLITLQDYVSCVYC